MNELPLETGSESSLPAFYDLATAGLGIVALVLLVTAVVSIFRANMSATASIIWFAVVLLLPIAGPIAFLLYRSKSKSHATN